MINEIAAGNDEKAFAFCGGIVCGSERIRDVTHHSYASIPCKMWTGSENFKYYLLEFSHQTGFISGFKISMLWFNID